MTTATVSTEALPIHKKIAELIHGDLSTADSIAVEGTLYNLEHPETMIEDTFIDLERLREKLEMDCAMGRDVAPNFDEIYIEVNELVRRAPWVMDPDEGCVPKVAGENVGRCRPKI